MEMLREETWWTRGLGLTNPRAWPDDHNVRLPPPDYDADFQEVYTGRHDNMANFELPRKPRKRLFLICCFVILAAILLIGIVATPTAISLVDDGNTDLQSGTDQDQNTVDFFSCFILRRSDTVELNDTTSNARIQFEQEFCDSIQTAVNPISELNCEILRFVGAPAVVVYKLEFPENEAALMRNRIEAAIIEVMSQGQMGAIAINNLTDVSELTDGVTNDEDCRLFPIESVSSSSEFSILTTTFEPESSSSSEVVPTTTVEPETSASFQTIPSSTTESVSSVQMIVSTMIHSEFSSSASMMPSNSSFFKEASSIILTPSSISSAEFETTLITSFEPSFSIDLSTKAMTRPPTTFLPGVPTSHLSSVEDSASFAISPSSVLTIPSCSGHDDGPCEHDHRLDFSHHWQCYVWWTLLFESGLWEQDVMYSISLEPFEYQCFQRLLRVPWINEDRKMQIRRARNRLSNFLITGRPRFMPPEPFNIPDCEINRMITLQCYIWWAIVADAHPETFFDITLSPLKDFEEACFNQTFPRANEARDIIFAIATGENVTDFIPGNGTLGGCGCGGLPPRRRFRRMMRCYAWWVHLYQSGLWDQDILSSPFLNFYELACGRILVSIPFLSQNKIKEIRVARKRFRAERDGFNITALNMTTPLDGNVMVCPSNNSSAAPDIPAVESGGNLKNCFVWWHFIYDELWLMNVTSLWTPWEWWCYTKIIDGSFEIGHHHHIHD